MSTKLYIHGVTSMNLMLWLLAIALLITRFWMPATPVIPYSHVLPMQIAVLGISMAWMLCISPSVRLNRLLSLFILIAAASVFINPLPDKEAALSRLLIFIGVMFLISPLAVSDELNRLRVILWRLTWWALRLLAICNIADYLYYRSIGFIKYGGSDGLCLYPVWMGILSALVVINSFWHLNNGRRLSFPTAIYHGILIAIGFLLVVVSGSRSAFLALIVGLIPTLWMMRHERFKLFFFAIAAIAALAVNFLPDEAEGRAFTMKSQLWHHYGQSFGSREKIWQTRVEEFHSSPLLGIGFSYSPHVNICYRSPDGTGDYSLTTADPGSSWLNTFSTTGIFGLLLLLFFNLRLAIHLWRNRHADISEFAILSGLIIAMWVHACFEGWMLYAGNPKFYFFWLLTSMIYQFKIKQIDIFPHVAPCK